MSYARLPVFEKFIDDLRAVWSAETDDARRMENAKPLVEAFVKDPDLKAHSAQWPSTEGRKNLLLYVDPAYEFVVNAVVRGTCWVRSGTEMEHGGAQVITPGSVEMMR
jgi:predicted metal-dependent enzyme (double-stranded beta helix superfamily)